MTAVLALLSALIVGGADFNAALATRREDSVTVSFGMQVGSILGIVVFALVVPFDRVTADDIVWALVSGVGSAGGYLTFFKAFSLGRMSVVAPVSAVTAAIGPVLIGALEGDEVPGLAYLGCVVGIFAIILVTLGESDAPGAAPTRAVLPLALGAGGFFSLYFVALSHTSDEAGLWPLVPSRFVSIALLAAVVGAGRRRFVPDRSVRTLVVAAGLLEAVASALVLVALQRGPLGVASVLASLYPLSTVLLAATILKERLRPSQRLGIPLALVAAALASMPA